MIKKSNFGKVTNKNKDLRDGMDIQRARQILYADETITVLHNGSPIWIESLSANDNTVMVKPMDNKGGLREVPVAELVEG